VRLGISGHQNIPPAAHGYIERELESAIARHHATQGLSSLARGADQMFARAIVRARVPLTVVVPCTNYESTLVGPDDIASYRALLRQASTVESLPFSSPSEHAFLAAGQRIVDLCDLLIAVWDGRPAGGLGGTGDIVAYARKTKRRLEVIWPVGAFR
jgi:hypothetical protein